MSIKIFNNHVLHVETANGKFPDKLEHDGEAYTYGTHYNHKRTIAVYYKESWMND